MEGEEEESFSLFTCLLGYFSRKGSRSNLLAAGVLQHLLGADPLGHVKWGSNSATARLACDLELNMMLPRVSFCFSSIDKLLFCALSIMLFPSQVSQGWGISY